jgi:hypothetical protein
MLQAFWELLGLEMLFRGYVAEFMKVTTLQKITV